MCLQRGGEAQSGSPVPAVRRRPPTRQTRRDPSPPRPISTSRGIRPYHLPAHPPARPPSRAEGHVSSAQARPLVTPTHPAAPQPGRPIRRLAPLLSLIPRFGRQRLAQASLSLDAAPYVGPSPHDEGSPTFHPPLRHSLTRPDVYLLPSTQRAHRRPTPSLLLPLPYLPACPTAQFWPQGPSDQVSGERRRERASGSQRAAKEEGVRPRVAHLPPGRSCLAAR